MKSATMWTAAALAAVIAGTAAAAQYVYPAKGQSAKQQQKDEGECYTWAKGKTGIDPANAQATPPSAPPGRAVAKGAVRGAVAAEVVDGDAGRGAAAGAVVGGARNARKQQGQQQAQSAALGEFNKAYSACLEGRGYTVK